jgi:hypothetical protein
MTVPARRSLAGFIVCPLAVSPEDKTISPLGTTPKSPHISGDRLLDVHIKDLRDLKVKESQCIVDEGAMPIARISSSSRK